MNMDVLENGPRATGEQSRQRRAAWEDMQSLVELHLPESLKIAHPYGHSNKTIRCWDLSVEMQTAGRRRRQSGMGMLRVWKNFTLG